MGLQSTATGKATQARRTGLVATSLRLDFSQPKKEKAPDIPRRGEEGMWPCAASWHIPKLAGLWQTRMLLSGILERDGPCELTEAKLRPSHGKPRASLADADRINYWCCRMRLAPFPASVIKPFSREAGMAPHFFWLRSGHSCRNTIVL